jgi:hypothetical protein
MDIKINQIRRIIKNALGNIAPHTRVRAPFRIVLSVYLTSLCQPSWLYSIEEQQCCYEWSDQRETAVRLRKDEIDIQEARNIK